MKPKPSHQQWIPNSAAQPPTVISALSRLRDKGYRMTKPRTAALVALVKIGRPVTTEELHSELQGSCDLVTVYRMLDTFELISLVRRTFRPNGTALYQLDMGVTCFHVLDRATNKLTPIDGSDLTELRTLLNRIVTRLDKEGFKGIAPSVSFFAGTKGIYS
jgi:Fe2+ or Zn2+ uptake regulation protein